MTTVIDRTSTVEWPADRDAMPRRRLAPAVAIVAGAAGTFVVTAAAARGSLAPAAMGVGLLAAVGVVLAPKAGVIALIAATLTVLPQRFMPFDVAGARSDLPELVMSGLMAAWIVHALAVRPPPAGDAAERSLRASPFVGPLALLAVAAAAGALVGVAAGASRGEVLGPLKTYGFWLLALPLAWFVATRSDLDWLEGWLFRTATAAAILTLVMAATGNATAADDDGVVVTLATVDEAQRIRPPVQQLLFLVTLLLVHRIAQRGVRPAALVQLGLFLTVQALSFNRSTWAALAFCVVAFVVLRPGRRVPLAAVRVSVVAVVVGGGAYLAGTAGLLGPTADALATRARSVVHPDVLDERSLSDRGDENEAAVQTLRRRPLTGVGLGQPYGARRGVWSPAAGRVVYFDRLFIHNSFLGAWLHLGLAGVAAFVWLGVAVTRRTLEARRVLAPADAGRALAAGLAIAGMGLQALVQTKLYHRPTIVVVALALTFLSAPRSREVAEVAEVGGVAS